MLWLELCRCPSDLFPVQQTTYRIGNHVPGILLGMVGALSVNVKSTAQKVYVLSDFSSNTY